MFKRKDKGSNQMQEEIAGEYRVEETMESDGGGDKKRGKRKEKTKKQGLNALGTGKNARGKKVYLNIALVVIGVIVLNVVTSLSLRATVEVVKLKASVPPEGILTEDNMYKDTMQKGEYEKQGIVEFSDGSKKRGIVLWSDRDQILNAFASYYIRENTPIFWDAISKESPKQYSYLYRMDGELLKLNISADQFGEMLVPGDKINVRVAYQEQVYTLPTEAEFRMQQQTGIQPATSKKRQVKLFNAVSVLDILNGNGESIFDIYYDVLSLPKKEQIEMVNSEEFKARVAPAQILLNVTPEEADRYMEIQAKGPMYMMTLLPRNSSNAITEMLNEIQIGLARGQK